MGAKNSGHHRGDDDEVAPPPVTPLPPTTEDRVIDGMVHGCRGLEMNQIALDHNDNRDFTRPMCSRCPIVLFVAFRFCVAGYALGSLLYFLIEKLRGVTGAKIFIYMETWTYVEITIYLIVSFTNVFIDIYREFRGLCIIATGERTPLHYKVQWMFFNISLTSSCVVAATFWTWVVVTGVYPTNSVYDVFSLHGLWLIIAVLEVGLVTIPIRFEHIIYPLIYGVIYLIFSVIYWGAGGTDPYGHHYIYVFLDYGGHPVGAVVAIALATLGIFVIHGFFTLLFMFKEKWVDQCCSGESDERSEELEMLQQSGSQSNKYTGSG